MPGTNPIPQSSIPTKNNTLNLSSLTYNKQPKLPQNNSVNQRHHQPQQQYFQRNFQTHVIKPLRSNQSLILPGMGVIGRSIKFETKKEKSRYRLRGIGFSQNDGIAQFSPDYGRNCHRPFSSGNDLGQEIKETGIGPRSQTNGLSSYDPTWNNSLRLPQIQNGDTNGGYLSDSNIGAHKKGNRCHPINSIHHIQASHKMDKNLPHANGDIIISPKTRRRTKVTTSPNHVNLSFSQDSLPFSGVPPVKPNIEIMAYTGRKSPKQWREPMSSKLSTSTSALQSVTDQHFMPISNSNVARKARDDQGKSTISSKRQRQPFTNGDIPSIQIQNLQSFSSTDLG